MNNLNFLCAIWHFAWADCGDAFVFGVKIGAFWREQDAPDCPGARWITAPCSVSCIAWWVACLGSIVVCNC
jgi:hypothetical protein